MKPRPAPTALRPDGARTADAADDGANARPSIRTLARQCGVSRMTVSRALRNDPHVRSAVRERVCAMALAAGYAGNPFVSAWMAEMRRARRRTLRCGLAWICGPLSPAAWETRPELSGYLRGARERAAALGYALDPVALPADASAGVTDASSSATRARSAPISSIHPARLALFADHALTARNRSGTSEAG